MSDMSGLPDRFQKLQQKFKDRCRQELAALIELSGAAELDPVGRSQLSGIAHSLAGAGGTFGFAEISTAAGQLEEALLADAPAEELQVLLRKLIAAIEGATSL